MKCWTPLLWLLLAVSTFAPEPGRTGLAACTTSLAAGYLDATHNNARQMQAFLRSNFGVKNMLAGGWNGMLTLEFSPVVTRAAVAPPCLFPVRPQPLRGRWLPSRGYLRSTSVRPPFHLRNTSVP